MVGMLTLLQRIKDSNITLKGDLEFVNDWQYFSLGGFAIPSTPRWASAKANTRQCIDQSHLFI